MNNPNTDSQKKEYTQYDSLKYSEAIHLLRYQEKLTEIQDIRNENFKAIISMGQNAIKASLMIQAGAIVAMMAFFSDNLSELISRTAGVVIFAHGMLTAVAVWTVGCMACVIAYGTAYLSQSFYLQNYAAHAEEYSLAVCQTQAYTVPVSTWAARWQYVSIVIVAVSYICLGIGIYLAWDALMVFCE